MMTESELGSPGNPHVPTTWAELPEMLVDGEGKCYSLRLLCLKHQELETTLSDKMALISYLRASKNRRV